MARAVDYKLWLATLVERLYVNFPQAYQSVPIANYTIVFCNIRNYSKSYM